MGDMVDEILKRLEGGAAPLAGPKRDDKQESKWERNDG